VRQANAEREALAGEDDKSKAIAGGKVQAGKYGAANANAESKAQAEKMASEEPTQT
jgi:hypothetical protein